jgi:AbrB family looped-hinge helix DNA binding protein
MVFAIMNGMTVQIDRAGRIVVPKRVRERLSLRPGSELTLEESAKGLLLRPVERVSPLVEEKDGFVVHMGKFPAGFRWESLIEDEREDRIRETAGL